MNINPDTVPSTFPEAVDALFAALDPSDRAVLAKPGVPAMVHMSVGRALRGLWSLWDRETPIALDFKSRFKLFGHGDDISAILIESIHARSMGLTFLPIMSARRCRAHWASYLLDPYTGQPLFQNGTREHPYVAGMLLFNTKGASWRCSDCLKITYNDGDRLRLSHQRTLDNHYAMQPFYCADCLAQAALDARANQYES